MIYVVRHGQTDWNKEGRLQGRSGLPLNADGVAQAKTLRQNLSHVQFGYMFSSPQERAVQTAEIATGMKVITDTRLDVFDLGEADGLQRENVKLAGAIPDPRIYKGVEDTGAFVRRIFSFMQELEAKYADKDVNLVVVGHRCTTGCIGAYFDGMPDNGNVLRLSSTTGEFKAYAFKQR